MRSVTTKRLKDRLSYYLSRVRAGEIVLVSDRDQVIAQITKPAFSLKTLQGRTEQILADLAASGNVRLGKRARLEPFPKVWSSLVHQISGDKFERIWKEIRQD